MDTAAIADSLKYVAPIITALGAWWLSARKQKQSAAHYEFRWLEQTRKEVQDLLNERIERLKEEVIEVRERCDRLEFENEALEKKIESLRLAVNKRDGFISMLKAKFSVQEQEMIALKKKLGGTSGYPRPERISDQGQS